MAQTWNRIPRHYKWATLLYVVVAAFFIHDWDGYVFEQSVRDLWAGKSPYAVADGAPYYTFLAADDHDPQWYAYPPLPLLTMAFSFAPAVLFDMPPMAERILLKVPMIAGTLLLAFAARAWGRRLDQPEERIQRIEKVLLFNPFLIIVGPVWGMTDPALLAFFLLGMVRIDEGRPREAGMWFAFAALIKPFPVLLALPFLALYLHRHGWKSVASLGITCVPVLLAVSLPFFFMDPSSYWRQVIGMHLARQPQGLTVWTVGPLQDLDRSIVRGVSLALMGIALFVLSLLAPRLRGRTAPLVLLFATSVQLLLWNRVVNEQYLVLVLVPLLMLWVFQDIHGRRADIAAKTTTWVFAAITAIQGYHFVTFIPPDIAWAVFKRPVDVLAHGVGDTFDWGWGSFLPRNPLSVFIVASLVVLAAVSITRMRQALENPETRMRRRFLPTQASAASVLGSFAFVAMALAPAGAATVVADEATFADPVRVGAFYYLWWNNPAHDPFLDKPYGNWYEATQFSQAGYYTQTAGVARMQAQLMRDSGVDLAIVSYHTPETKRYRMFQEQAAGQGLWVAPLIELNQIYDQDKHRPLNDWDEEARYAVYRLDNSTRHEITKFVLELKNQLKSPGQYKIDGRPVLYFYDSYVSGVGFNPEDRDLLIQTLMETRTIEELRWIFNKPDLKMTYADIREFYPEQLANRDPPRDMAAFYNDGRLTDICVGAQGCKLNQSVVWRQAHLDLHNNFWHKIRADVEKEVGPVFIVGGHAMNEAAGFEAGIVKSIHAMEEWDGGFIYSPSFTWGVSPRDEGVLPYRLISTYNQSFQLWEDRDLWLTAYAKGTGTLSSFGIAPAYDDRVKRTRSGFQIPAVHDGRLTYDLEWESTLSNPPTLPLVATWNEFFEGSSIEPSEEYGDKYLGMTRQYREALPSLQRPVGDIVTVTHERSSRLHPKYSEMDKPHWWGLKTIAAAGRLFPDRVVALDGLQPRLPSLAEPSLVILDGGRDLYNETSMSKPINDTLERWMQAGVPTLIIGREVLESMRDQLPVTCQVNDEINLGRSIFADAPTVDVREDDDAADAGDQLRAVATAEGTRLVLDRNGATFAFGHKCAELPNVAFVNLKPWGPINTWETTSRTDDDCLATILTAFFPETLATLSPSCVMAPVEFTR